MKLWMSTFADVEKDFSLWANRDKCRSRIKSTWLNLIGVLILVGRSVITLSSGRRVGVHL